MHRRGRRSTRPVFVGALVAALLLIPLELDSGGAGPARAAEYPPALDLGQRQGSASQPGGPDQPTPPPIPGSRAITIKRGGRTAQTVTFETEPAPDGRPMRAGSLLVALRPEAAPARRAAIHRAAGAVVIGTAGSAATVRVQVARQAAAQAIATYRAQPEVAHVEPDYVRTASFTTNDPNVGSQYGLARIAAPAAWDKTHGSSSVRIAILDCGIYSSSSTFDSNPDPNVQEFGHPDVRDKVVAEVNLSGSPLGADDWCDHGTHVAGIAAASTNNGLGIAGVGYDTSLMNVKVLDDAGSGSISTVTTGIRWATDNGAKVINLSLGGAGACTASEQDAVDYAWSHGVVVIAAAGNDGSGQSSAPANCNNVISVAGTNAQDAKPSWSNYGANVDVGAPGDMILSANNVGGYEYKTGTSMASPHVAGVAALLWASGRASASAVATAILEGADPIAGTGTLWAHGRLNALNALNFGVTTTPVPRVSPAVRSSTEAPPGPAPARAPDRRETTQAPTGPAPAPAPSRR